MIIDQTGDGSGNPLYNANSIAGDGDGNIYLSGAGSNNAFRIASDGAITKVIDQAGGGISNLLTPRGIAVDRQGHVYIGGSSSDNAFDISPGGTITEIIDETGDGEGNLLDTLRAIATDGAGNVYVCGGYTNNAFRIALDRVFSDGFETGSTSGWSDSQP